MSLQKASKHSKTLKNSFKTPRNKLQCQRPVLSLSGHEPNNTKLQNQTKQQARARWPSNIWISSRPLGHFARNNWLTLSLLILLQWGQTFRTQVLRHWCDHAWRIQMKLAPTHWIIDLLTLPQRLRQWQITHRDTRFLLQTTLKISMLTTPTQTAPGQQAATNDSRCKRP